MPRRRYPKYGDAVNDLLDFARATRRFAALYPDDVCVADILQHLDRFGAHQWWDLLDIVLDHEERHSRSATKRRKG